MTLLVGITIGIAIGWSFPQPTWVATVWSKIKSRIT